MNYKILSIFAMVVTTQATFATESKEVRTDHITSQIISAVESIQPGQPFQVALRLKIDDHWHTYYKNPGDSGLATSISWNLPEGFTTSKIQWQTPKRLPYGPLTNFGYEGTVLHVATLVAPTTLKPGSTITLKARGDWLVCEEICIPGSADHELSLPVSAELANPSQWLEEFDAFKKSQPKPLGKNHVIAGISQGTLQLLIPEANSVETVHFFPDQEGFIDNTVEPMITSSPEGLLLSVPLVTNPTEPE
ncbi:MAG: protein-disulfide reductase DsbD domain-containing protein, partial [Verrucomicrobiota bacterium]